MIKKVKIRDLTEEQQKRYCDKKSGHCDGCPFCLKNFEGKVWSCAGSLSHSQFSDEFLDQEVEIEVPDILTEEEKEYLEAVINPFKERIVGIGKALLCGNTEFIYFVTREIADGIICSELPPFDAGTAYKGMEAGKKYTLEELGL